MRHMGKIALWVIAVAAVSGFGAIFYVESVEPKPMFAEAPSKGSIPPAGPATVWDHFAGDAGATQYSSIDQITPENVGGLKVAWTYRTGEIDRHPDWAPKSAAANTPIMAGGSLITCTPSNRVIALDPATGKEKWVFEPGVKIKIPGGMRYVCRGLAVWRDDQAKAGDLCAERLIYGTNDLRIFALDAATGKMCPGFGQSGQIQVDVKQQTPGEIAFYAPPAVVKDTVIFGSSILDGYYSKRPLGTVRAFDARTGTPKWTFDPVPQDPNDPAAKSWENGSNIGFGGGNVWPDMSVDEERGMLFLPTTSPSVDLYGGQRNGDNHYGNSVVALKAETGEKIWDYQIVHHDIWDYDLPTAPLLADLELNGKVTPAVIQLTKQGMVFVLDRTTGVPLFPVEERPFPQSNIPGEKSSPTQPIPTVMPDLMPTTLEDKDAWGFTFWDRNACRKLMEKYPDRGLYAPESEAGTIMFPLATGGSNLGMRSYDPKRRLLIANTIRFAAAIRMVPRDPYDTRSDSPYTQKSEALTSPFGVPCNPPPWGQLAALDVENHKVVWQVPLGTIEKMGSPFPFLFGTPNRGGPITTGGGLTFISAAMDQAFRAFDTSTGHELWRAELPAGGQATPMTYAVNGKQYVVLVVGGHNTMMTQKGDYIIAYALP